MWKGAVSVFAANAHQPAHAVACFEGLQRALGESIAARAAARELAIVFGRDPAIEVPQALVRGYFEALYGGDGETHVPLYNFQKWVTRRAQSAPDEALEAAEIAFGAGASNKHQVWDDEFYPLLLTRLFREGEEREEIDRGGFLERTIALQDVLIRLGAHRIDQWLRDAERPA